MIQIPLDFWQWLGVGILMGPLMLAIASLLFMVLSDLVRTMAERAKNQGSGGDAEPVEELAEEVQEEVLTYIDEIKKTPR